MSAAAGGAPPPPSGGSDDEPWKNFKGRSRGDLPQGVPWAPEDNDHNAWQINMKIKTCKCSLCGERVKKDSYSFQCQECYFHICKQCAEPDGESGSFHKANAYFQLTNKCKCGYVGRVPAFEAWLGRHPEEDNGPPKRFEEDRRMKEIKAKTKEKQRLRAEAELQESSASCEPHASELQDATYMGAKASHSAIAFRNPDREGKRKDYRDPNTPPSDTSEEPARKRSRYAARAAHESTGSPSALAEHDIQADFATFVSAEKRLKTAPIQHLQDGTTVIVGAGIVGLCIARELAIALGRVNTKHTIIVVDLQESYCRMASRECSGLLSIQDLSEKCNGLAELTQQCWNQLLMSKEPHGFSQRVGIRQHSGYILLRDKKDEGTYKPSWFAKRKQDALELDAQTIGKVNTRTLAKWLYEQCLQLGVDFRFSQKICSTSRIQGCVVTGVRLTNVKDGTRSEKIDCQNVVVAAGPFSSEIVDKAFTKIKEQNPEDELLANNVQRALWLDLPLNSMSGKDDVGLHLADIAKTSNTLGGRVTVVAHRARSVVRMATVAQQGGEGPLLARDALNPKFPDEVPFRQFEHLVASVYRGEDGRKSNAAAIKDKGFAFISTSAGGLPVIDKVPSSKFVVDSDKAKGVTPDARLDGVWMCFGFGMHGTTLAPGAARALVRRMIGEPSGIEDRHFSI